MLKKIAIAILTYLTAAQSLEWFYTKWPRQDPPFVWAITVVGAFAVFYVGGALCSYKFGTLKLEIERCAEAKKRLEAEVLKKRRTSNTNAGE